MRPRVTNYFTYLPDLPSHASHACRVTAAGYTRILPQTPYPPQRHPVDHHFSWSDGRVLRAYQIVYIPRGRGSFESAATRKPLRIQPGTLFILFPGVWHRYAPDTKTGWVEHWVECKGSAFVEAQRRGVIRPEQPLLRVGINHDLIDAFALCHRWAQRMRPARASALAALGLLLLAILEDIEPNAAPPTNVENMVHAAQSAIVERFQEPFTMRELAKSLSVSYSGLRQRFKEYTGLSPKQYQVQIRLQRAQDLLSNTARSIKEIAAILGFDSPYHFSLQFKRFVGVSPSAWRQRNLDARKADGR